MNNLLLVILASAEMILDAPADQGLAWAEAREIRETALRGAALTRQLLSSSPREAERRPPARVELNAVVRREEQLLRRLLRGTRAELRLALAPEAGAIDADPDQLGRVILNLVVNARDAMPGGGTVTVVTDAVRIGSAGLPQCPELAPAAYALLAVRDTGIGMDETTKARIFEPFFTTKAPGAGTGLGLAIVAEIVRDSGGTIRVESAPGAGSSFVIYWPRAEPPTVASVERA
ncbi:MAG TPA: ATP-binding protein [Gemmatimonadaceae bacterium]|nr:ATP-binding protein [Gemmatimonadaceae bacterium]